MRLPGKTLAKSDFFAYTGVFCSFRLKKAKYTSPFLPVAIQERMPPETTFAAQMSNFHYE